jgi:hypothetical protein
VTVYGADEIQLIDQRIDAAQVKAQKMGTVVTRDSTSPLVVVSFDGSSGIGQPAKCFETVVVDVGDRVGLIRFEGEWIVVGNYTARTWADELVGFAFTSTSTYSLATFADMPSSPAASFVKARDSTQLQIRLNLSCRSATAASTIGEFGLLITFPDATTLDQVVFRRVFNTADAHQDMSAGLTTNLTLPAGPYGLTARWRRVSGSGTLTVDVNDSVTMGVKEVTP